MNIESKSRSIMNEELPTEVQERSNAYSDRVSKTVLSVFGQENVKDAFDFSCYLTHQKTEGFTLHLDQHKDLTEDKKKDILASFEYIHGIADSFLEKVSQKIPEYIDRSFQNESQLKEKNRLFSVLDLLNTDFGSVFDMEDRNFSVYFRNRVAFQYIFLFHEKASFNQQCSLNAALLEEARQQKNIFLSAVHVLSFLEHFSRYEKKTLEDENQSEANENLDLGKEIYSLDHEYDFSGHFEKTLYKGLSISLQKSPYDLILAEGIISVGEGNEIQKLKFSIDRGYPKTILSFYQVDISAFFSPAQYRFLEYHIFVLLKDSLKLSPHKKALVYTPFCHSERGESESSLLQENHKNSHSTPHTNTLSSEEKKQKQKQLYMMKNKILGKSGRDILKAFYRLLDITEPIRIKGSHHILPIKEGKGTFTIPLHKNSSNPIGRGLLTQIIEQSGFSVEEIYEVL